MKTKLFKTFARASKSAPAKSIWIGATDQHAFAHIAWLLDFGNSTIAERVFCWGGNDKHHRTLRVFSLPNGDIGFRAFGSAARAWVESEVDAAVAARIAAARGSIKKRARTTHAA